MNLAVIPARGGSKRIARKNIRDFCGQPMISYAISSAKESGLFDNIVVSTDDIEIAYLSEQLGAKVPFLRSPELADDFTPTVPVIAHAIEFCRGIGWCFEYVCCIYPCVPFIRGEELKECLGYLKASNANYSFPVSEYASPIQRALFRASDGSLTPCYPEFQLARTQDLERGYCDAGQFYWAKADAWLTNPRIHSSAVGCVIPNWRVVDIDTPDDWRRAELIHRAMNSK